MGLNLRTDFQAKGDGNSDDTAAIKNWLNAITPGKCGSVPAGVYKYIQPITYAQGNISLIGEGPNVSKFLYAGSNNTADQWTFGNGASDLIGLYLSGLQWQSATRMASGYGVNFKRLCRSNLETVWFDSQDGTGNFYNAVWFDGVDEVLWDSASARAQNDGVDINGLNNGPAADLAITGGKIAGCGGTGIAIGGGFGGFFLGGGIDVIANGTNFRIDNSLVPINNREIFVGDAFFDSSQSGDNVFVNDILLGGAGYISFDGTWNAGASQYGLHVVKWDGFINVTGGTMFNNHKGNTLYVDPRTAVTNVGCVMR